MIKLIWIAIILTIIPLNAQAITSEQIQSDFQDAKNYYLYGDYRKVITKLTPLVDPNPLLSPENLKKAYELLGLAHFYEEEWSPARKHFKRLIWMDPDFRLNPVLVPVPAISFYDDLYKQEIDQIRKEREAIERKRKEDEARRLEETMKTIYIETQYNSRVFAALPFGAGQFQNNRPYLGAFFLTSEMLTLGASVSLFFAVESLRTSTGQFDQRDLERAQDLQRAQLITGGVGIGLAVLGAGLALWRFEEIRSVNRRVEPRAPANAGLLRWEF